MIPLTFQHDDGTDAIILHVEPDGDGWRVRLPDGTEHRIAARRLPGDVWEISEGPRTFRVPFARTERGIELSLEGEAFAFVPGTARQGGAGRTRRASGALTAPMAGVVADVLVAEGEAVEAYQPLVVIEAMKVFATIEAPFAGTVKAVHVQKLQPVEHGATVVEVVAGEGTGG